MTQTTPHTRAPLRLEWGVAEKMMHGERISGDQYLVRDIPDGQLIAVVDGIGHGPEAAAAAQIALDTLNRHKNDSLIAMVRRCHERLQDTRGVVMSLAVFNARESTLAWMGVGNVEGVLRRAYPAREMDKESLLLRGGVVGYLLPPLLETVFPVHPGDTLAFATDGIEFTFTEKLASPESPKALAARIFAAHQKDTDDALILVARFRGAES